MKKQLFIIRHAHAEDLGNSAMLRDFSRELTSKGIIQSARMGKFLKDSGVVIETFVSSPANRAADTARIIMEQLKRDKDDLILDENLYGGGPKGYLKAINDLENSVQSAAIFGHNPDISFFAEYLTRDDVGGGMKKATAIHLEFDGLSWAELSGKSGSLIKRTDVDQLGY